ncbi:carboxypeptidase-like regulatory domain-containing protein [Patescibacteria group bacterium]|nr:carboxypeptidase-like regulatory domain-containing protein [Patescibacteria group bacterium]MBU3999704.1 carboxypeptidase-like regulatory domain-containing protein [Patescibacteria group bacterium]MBU4057196.1 carboxypeptidase-like regulatory domain-containing protein [Patescibacteria group bacterium]MBU4368265.1 carboxypeptidase-like regulatory domain-containing protein [Patescibacteria group bacterium]
MDINKNTKILIGILVIIIMVIGGWWILRSKELGKEIEIKGKLEVIENNTPLFNKDCLGKDLKVGDYYLRGLCKSRYFIASLLEIIGEEVRVMGTVRVVEAVVPSEENPEVLITKTFEVIEVEEITPPEIIMIVTETTRYQPGEKIAIHFKHYLKKNVFSHFGTENSTCAIESVEKKNEEWERITSWSQPADCEQITLKEIKPYHLSGEFNIYEWQPPSLEPGQYRLKTIYKLAGEDEWKTVYFNEFVVLKEVEPIKDIGIKIDLNLENEMVRINMTPPFAFLTFPGNYKLLILDRNNSVLWNKNISTEEICHQKEYYSEYPPYGFEDSEDFEAFLREFGKLPETGYEAEFKKLMEKYHGEEFKEIEEYYKIIGEDFEKFLFEQYKYDKELYEEHKKGELEKMISIICDDSEIKNDLKNIPYKPEMTVFKMYYNEDLVAREYLVEAVIKGKITDSLGNPVGRVRADFCEKLSVRGDDCGGSVSDENGDYIIDKFAGGTKLREGIYELWIYPDRKLNLKKEFKEINLGVGETKIVNITLKQGGSIAGKITDKEGNPLSYGAVYEIGFEAPRYAICEERVAKKGECELGTFIIPDLEPGDYKIGAFVKIGEKYIDLSTKEVKVEVGKTAVINFVLEE